MDYISFSKSVVNSDKFVEMSLSAQALYFHIVLNAQSKGISNNIFSIIRSIQASKKDVKELMENGFIKYNVKDETFEIVHWYQNKGTGETVKKRNTYGYRKWRNSVIERDKKCQICGSKENLEAHHIKEFSKYPLERLNLDNGVALCQKCHKKIHKKNKRGVI